MKKTLLALIVALTSFGLWAQSPPAIPTHRLQRFGLTNGPVTQPRYVTPRRNATGFPGAANGAANERGFSPTAGQNSTVAAAGAPPEEMIQPGTIDFTSADVNQVLDVYSKLVNRTVLRANLPAAQIILKTQTPLTKTEAIQALQAVLALNGIAVINIGDKFVKALPVADANAAGAEIDRGGETNIPDLGSYVTHIVQLKYVKPTEMQPILAQFAKLPNSIFPIDGNGILVIRDYAENVKRMMEMINQIDVDVPAEYISEVIPIRYAKVDDIASALNALGGGGGGATVSIGTAKGSSQISGLAPNRSSGFGGSSGIGGIGGNSIGGNSVGGYQSGGLNSGGAFGNRSSFGSTTPNGTPSGGSTFQQRLQNIINRTSGGGTGGSGSQQDIQLFGQTKIIPNESSSSLLIYATRQDMEVIKGIIAKLDVPLAQVLVEAAIIDYSLGPNTFSFGVSAAQNPTTLGGTAGANSVVGAGGGNNGASLLHDLSSLTGAGTNGASSFANNLGGGLSYFGNIGPNWDVAMTAVNADSHASVIQRPRIQTSQAVPAQFFVGDTVPYVTGNSYGTAYGSGVSYSQLSVGVELDVTPFINPDGLVVMDIQQEIDDLNGYTTIENVGQVPNTIKRTLNAEIAVRDRDTVMLGGFIKSNKSTSRSGVPYLMDIPILGNLFTQRSDSKQREELIVLMRPTVLKTPELAAKNTIKEQQRLPGISETAAENEADERKLIDAERKRELKEFKETKHRDGYFVPALEEQTTNSVGETEDSVAPETLPSAGVSAPNPPEDSNVMQQKAAAALTEKMNELNHATNAPAK